MNTPRRKYNEYATSSVSSKNAWCPRRFRRRIQFPLCMVCSIIRETWFESWCHCWPKMNAARFFIYLLEWVKPERPCTLWCTRYVPMSHRSWSGLHQEKNFLNKPYSLSGKHGSIWERGRYGLDPCGATECQILMTSRTVFSLLGWPRHGLWSQRPIRIGLHV